jgi:hypothetical protein
VRNNRKNVMKKLVSGLKKYIEKYNIEKDSAGNLILYKAVRSDFSPWWPLRRSSYPCSGAYYPGTLVRNSKGVTKNRHVLCGKGLYVGTYDCACTFAMWYIGYGAKIIQVSVDPYDVGCVPYRALEAQTLEDCKVAVKKLVVVKQVYI